MFYILLITLGIITCLNGSGLIVCNAYLVIEIRMGSSKDLQWLCRLDQYAIAKFAESFEMIPRTLAENAGLNAMEIISSLYAEHASGNTKVGIDLEEGVCKDVSTTSVWDLHVTK